MYDVGRKKQRWYRRECRRLLELIENIKPNYRPEPPFSDETIKLYGNLFFKPKGKSRRDIMSALLQKTEQIIVAAPYDLPFCRVVLVVYENNVAWSQIILFFEERYYRTFWDRTDIRYQKWTRVYEPSFAERMGLHTRLNGRCYLEQVCNDEENENFSQKIWFYE